METTIKEGGLKGGRFIMNMCFTGGRDVVRKGKKTDCSLFVGSGKVGWWRGEKKTG